MRGHRPQEKETAVSRKNPRCALEQIVEVQEQSIQIGTDGESVRSEQVDELTGAVGGTVDQGGEPEDTEIQQALLQRKAGSDPASARGESEEEFEDLPRENEQPETVVRQESPIRQWANERRPHQADPPNVPITDYQILDALLRKANDLEGVAGLGEQQPVAQQGGEPWTEATPSRERSHNTKFAKFPFKLTCLSS